MARVFSTEQKVEGVLEQLTAGLLGTRLLLLEEELQCLAGAV